MSRIDVSSSEIAPHPAEVTHDLGLAVYKLIRLANAATARGDDAGAAAWRNAIVIIETAVKTVGEARDQQNWSAKRTEPCQACKR